MERAFVSLATAALALTVQISGVPYTRVLQSEPLKVRVIDSIHDGVTFKNVPNRGDLLPE